MPQRELDEKNPRNFKNRNKLTFYIKRDGMRQFRWNLVARNGAILCSSPEGGYDRLGKCMASIAIIMEEAWEAAIENPVPKEKFGSFNLKKANETKRY